MVFVQAVAMRESGNPVKKELRNTGVCEAVTDPTRAQRSLIKGDGFRSPCMPDPRRIGYIRVSTDKQHVDRQVMQLEDNCDLLRIEYISAVATERPVFNALLEELCTGDTFVVVDIDRAFRSAIDAIATAEQLDARGVRFEILDFPLNTGSDEGAFVYGILALAAQLERKIIRRRTMEGLEAARRRGVRFGRLTCLADQTVCDAHAWMVETDLPCRYVAALLGVSRLTLQRSFHRLDLSYPINPSPKGPRQ